MKHISFPSIEQFKHVIRAVKDTVTFAGIDENGNIIRDYTRPMPVLKFTGTVKVHGTNFGAVFDSELYSQDNYWFQSRENIITPIKDNAGSAFFAESVKDKLFAIRDQIVVQHSVFDAKVCIFGEFAGGKIQKGVAVSGLDKFLYIFGYKIVPNDGSPAYWIDVDSVIINEDQMSEFNTARIFFKHQFPVFELDIDFAYPETVQNKLVALTNAVEEECPVGKFFGVSGTGEGIVWETNFNDTVQRFKVKGTKHQNSKVKTLAPVDDEKFATAKAFAESVCGDARLSQGIEVVFTQNGIEPDITMIGALMRWVVSDVIKEEFDNMIASGLEVKDISKFINNIVREWFLKNFI